MIIELTESKIEKTSEHEEVCINLDEKALLVLMTVIDLFLKGEAA